MRPSTPLCSAALASLVLLGMMACDKRPDFDAVLGEEPPGDSYPTLEPISAVLAIDIGDAEAAAEEDQALQERADALRQRASGLAVPP